ncbi:MAG: hypothetical protein ACK5WS_06635 [Alphaproteobacteria bacterium]|jgi:predicted transcriptional regulator|nr:hypothetical protein [Candidatus Jidaibacter sp.]
MKKLLCAAAVALAPVLVANAAEEYQAADNNKAMLQECRSHMQDGRLMRSAPDHLREDCQRLMSQSDAYKDAKEAKEDAKRMKKEAEKAKEDAKKMKDKAEKAKDKAEEAKEDAKKNSSGY